MKHLIWWLLFESVPGELCLYILERWLGLGIFVVEPEDYI